MTSTKSPCALLAVGRAAVVESAFLTGDFGRAHTLLEAARQMAEAHNDRKALAASLDQLGFLQHWKNLESEQGRDVGSELELFERALALRQDIRDDAGIAESLFHVGLVHQLFKSDWETALPYFERAKTLAESVGDDLLLSEAHRHIGGYFWLQRGDFDTALVHLRRSLQLREKQEFRGWLASGLITLGRCELAAGNSAEALEHLRQGVRLAEEIGLREWWTQSARETLSNAA